MNSSTTPDFWESYSLLSSATKEKARRAYHLWRRNPRHPSLRFKKVGTVWSISIGPDHRALGLMEGDTLHWFWIGDHDEYERQIGTLS